MGEYLTSYSNKVKYVLSGLLGSQEIAEPMNWNEDEKEFKRSEDAHGVFINLSNNLEFYKGDLKNNGGYDFLKDSYDLYGINASVLLIKSEILDNEWVESYRGYLDYSTYSRKNNIIKIKFNESGLYEKIKARKSEKIELGRRTTLDGDDIEPLLSETVELQGREILIINELNVSTSKSDITIPSGDNSVVKMVDKSQMIFDHGTGGNYEAIVIPVDMVAEQKGNVQTIYDYDILENKKTYHNQTKPGILFYADAPNDNIISVDLDFELEVVQDNYSSGTFRLDLVTFQNGQNVDFKNYIPLSEQATVVGNKIVYSESKRQISLLTGESLAIACHSHASSPILKIKINVNKANIRIYDPTYYESKLGNGRNFLLPYESLDRTLHIITGVKNSLKSTILGRTDTFNKCEKDGDASLTGITNGFWVRNFVDEPLTTSFKDFMDSFGAVWQIGYGIEKVGFKEQLRAEHINHFYQDEITIKIDQPNDIERTVASDYFYSSLDLGYSKPSGDELYEEAMGLDEYNVKNSYTTHISRVENKFEQISKYRADSYGTEFARRKPRDQYPQEDTRYDKDIMIMDLQRNDIGGTNFIQRKWQKDFENPTNFSTFVTGVFSPLTATNLRFSPLNLLLRWGFWIKCGLEKYKTTEIRYSSSEGNSKLTTQLKGSDKIYSENGNVLVSDLDRSLFIPEFIEFEYPIDSSLLNKINGTSINKDGETIMNYYGLVEFTNEDGLKEYGFLMELKPNGKGSWKLLKANKKEVRFNSYGFKEDNPTNPILTGETLNVE